MASDIDAVAGHAPTPTEYIVHHLTHLTSRHQEKIVGFSVINIDTVFWSVTVGIVACLLMWMAARRATSGVPGRLQSFVEIVVDQEPSAATETPLRGKDDGSVNAGISNFFRSLFGVGDKSTHSNVYAEAVRRGAYVLTVEAENDDQRLRAEGIMNRFGPVDIEERSDEWIRHGWRGHDPSTPLGAGKVRAVGGGKQSPDQK